MPYTHAFTAHDIDVFIVDSSKEVIVVDNLLGDTVDFPSETYVDIDEAYQHNMFIRSVIDNRPLLSEEEAEFLRRVSN